MWPRLWKRTGPRKPLLHIDFDAHPGVDAALEEVLAFRQVIDLDLAALQDPRARYRHVRESAGAFRNGLFTTVETLDEPSAEMGHLGKRVRLATLIGHDDVGPFLDGHFIRFKIPARIGSAGRGLSEQVI